MSQKTLQIPGVKTCKKKVTVVLSRIVGEICLELLCMALSSIISFSWTSCVDLPALRQLWE